jgi:hypothetical protein
MVMRTPFVALTVLLFLPAAAFAQPYVSAKVAYAGADFPLGAPYNGVIDDNSLGIGADVGFGFGRHCPSAGFSERPLGGYARCRARGERVVEAWFLGFGWGLGVRGRPLGCFDWLRCRAPS